MPSETETEAETAGADEFNRTKGDSNSTASSGASSCLNTTRDDDSASKEEDDLNGNSSEAEFEDVSVRWLGLNFVSN